MALAARSGSTRRWRRLRAFVLRKRRRAVSTLRGYGRKTSLECASCDPAKRRLAGSMFLPTVGRCAWRVTILAPRALGEYPLSMRRCPGVEWAVKVTDGRVPACRWLLSSLRVVAERDPVYGRHPCGGRCRNLASVKALTSGSTCPCPHGVTMGRSALHVLAHAKSVARRYRWTR